MQLDFHHGLLDISGVAKTCFKCHDLTLWRCLGPARAHATNPSGTQPVSSEDPEMSKPFIADKKPAVLEIEPRPRTYDWCACGRSKNQPYCDGLHRGLSSLPRSLSSRSRRRSRSASARARVSPPSCRYDSTEGMKPVFMYKITSFRQTNIIGELG